MTVSAASRKTACLANIGSFPIQYKISCSLKDWGNTCLGLTPACLYSSIIFWAYCCCVKPSKGMGTEASFNSGVIFTPSRLKSAMLSLWLNSVPLVGPEYKSVRQAGVPATNSCAVRALGLKPSIFPRSVLNSAKVMSLDLHSAVAGVLVLGSKGIKGLVHCEAKGVSKILVVACKSFCACRHTSSLSLVKVTSHSITPAPMRAAAS